MIKGYAYEHTNGQTIFSPNIVIDMAGGPSSYYEGPFVKRWFPAVVREDGSIEEVA